MGLRIRTNIASINAQRRLSGATNELRDSMAKLASGYRINKAADDAAGLAISDKLKSNIRSLEQAKRNTLDGISLVQIAEAGLEETSNMLIRLRELAVQAASDTIGNTEREFIDREFVAIKNEIDRVASSTEFNGIRLLAGKNKLPKELANPKDVFPMEIQVGADYYKKSDSLSSANPVNIIRIDLGNLNAFTHGDGSLNLGKAEDGARVISKSKAQLSLSALDKAITKVNDYRSYLGAIQNRLQTTITTLGARIENVGEARSRIRDTDFAAETARLTQANILQQAGTSVLATANIQPQIALKLLQ